MLTKPVKNVLVQATYMSGDRNAIASALRVNKDLGILIITAPGQLDSANELKNFYISVAGRERIEAVEVPSNGESNPDKALKSAYREISPNGSPRPWMSKVVDSKLKLQTATFGTTIIAKAFGKNAENARGQVRQLWKLDNQSDGLEGEVWNWLQQKGFRKDRRYVFLFAKQGERNAEKAHHFTSILTWNLLKDKIDALSLTGPSITPVSAGDRIGLRTSPSLAEFWHEPEWKQMLQGRNVDARSMQLGMWCYLAMHFEGVSIIGMRSGMLEVPALVGIRTLYLEEKFNQQAARMEKWHDKVPGFERQLVQVPPGITQQLYWKEQSTKNNGRNSRWEGKQHAIDNGNHLESMVMGKINRGPQGGGVPQNSFYSHETLLLHQQVQAEISTKGIQNFQLNDAEFDSIMEWVQRTPTPTDLP